MNGPGRLIHAIPRLFTLWLSCHCLSVLHPCLRVPFFFYSVVRQVRSVFRIFLRNFLRKFYRLRQARGMKDRSGICFLIRQWISTFVQRRSMSKYVELRLRRSFHATRQIARELRRTHKIRNRNLAVQNTKMLLSSDRLKIIELTYRICQPSFCQWNKLYCATSNYR